MILQGLILSTMICVSYSQTCRPTDKSATDLAILSPIAVAVSNIKLIDPQGPKSKRLYNVSAKVSAAFQLNNGGLKNKQKIKFGPVGKAPGCVNVKKGKSTYLVYLNSTDEAGFYWISSNPIKVKKSQVRKLKKLLCKGCLSPAGFKKSKKNYKKREGGKMNIKCKASGNPKPAMTWYRDGVIMDKSNTPKGMKVKTSRKGGASKIRIKSLTQEMNGLFTCNAKNALGSANFSATLVISPLPTTPTTTISSTTVEVCVPCPANLVGYCVHGNCCMDSENMHHCRCKTDYSGLRCSERSLYGVSQNMGEKDYLYHKRLVAILGMCLAVLLAAFICFAVYCLFRKKRSDLRELKLRNSGYSRTNSEPGHNEVVPENRPMLNITNAALNYQPQHIDGGITNSLETGISGAALLNEAHNRPSITSIASNKRGRLNALAKESAQYEHPHDTDESSSIVSAVNLHTPNLPRNNGLDHLIQPMEYSESPLLHNKSHERHKVTSFGAQEEEDDNETLSDQSDANHNHVDSHNTDAANRPYRPSVPNSPERMGHVDPSSHAMVSRTSDHHLSNPVYQTISPTSIMTVQAGYDSNDDENRDYDIPRPQDDDMFTGMHIPDTSLGDGFYFPDQSSNSNFVASAQRQNINLLSRQPNVMTISTSSIDDVASDDITSDDITYRRGSHSIAV